jgi:HEAT repeat protein
MMNVTHALLRPATALAAAEALRGARDKATVEGLVELLCGPHAARPALAAIAALDHCHDPIVLDALVRVLESPHASVRIVAVQALHERRATGVGDAVLRLLREDESWLARRAALRALAESPDADRWQVLAAATDPHWRVRHALIHVLLGWGATGAQREEIDERLSATGEEPRIQGLRVYLRYRWSGRMPVDIPLPPVRPGQTCAFWDWDAAVLTRNLERLGTEGRRQAIDVMPYLLGHADSRVRGSAFETLLDGGETRHLVQALTLLDDPRHGVAESVTKLLSALDLDRTEAMARLILHMPGPSPAQLAWAVDQAGVAFPIDKEETALLALCEHACVEPQPVRCALARLLSRWTSPQAAVRLTQWLDDPAPAVQAEALRSLAQHPVTWLDESTLHRLLHSDSPSVRAEAVRATLRQDGDVRLLETLTEDPDVQVRVTLAQCPALRAQLRSDVHPHVRAAALTPERAEALIEDPTRETSWHVLAQAARMRKVPLWRLEPRPAWQPGVDVAAALEPLQPHRTTPPNARALGTSDCQIAPLGISGHYGLPVEGFVRAVEAGVNLLFWEPNYQTLTDFMGRLAPRDRSTLHFIAGTFEADGSRIERDAERVLRTLKIERLTIFLLFWVQSWQRVSPDVREALDRLKASGKIAAFGLSTHSRPLAIEALQAGWDPVMVRHSAAHRGAEEAVLPRAAELGRSIITFNNTCYGRLLRPHSGQKPPSAADCYRYCLAQPGVTMCLSAPATLDQLDENLTSLREPELSEERRQRLRAFGDLVYQEDVVFRKLVRAL